MENRYDVFYTGKLLANKNADDVIGDFSKIFKISKEKSEKIILLGKEISVKRDIDYDMACRYKEVLVKIGMDVVLRQKDIEDVHTDISLKKKNIVAESPEKEGVYKKSQQEKPSFNPYEGPKSTFNEQIAIDDLDVSEGWKERFRLIEKAGGPKMPLIKELTFSERFKISGNILSFLFWIIYLPLKGLWRPALFYFILGVSLSLLVYALGFEREGRYLGYGISALVSMRTNILYYKRKVLGERSWF